MSKPIPISAACGYDQIIVIGRKVGMDGGNMAPYEDYEIALQPLLFCGATVAGCGSVLCAASWQVYNGN
jgi:hypothetical protein